MPRPEMASLISRLRGLTGDPAGPSQQFSDDELQAALDRYQTMVVSAPLRPVPLPLPNGTVEYRQHVADVGDWDDGESLTDAAYQAVTPATRDRIRGVWTFAAPGVNPPVLITGAYYDLYAAAADVLETWAARLSRQFDVSLDGSSFARSQQAASLRQQAASYRRLARPVTVTMRACDATSAY